MAPEAAIAPIYRLPTLACRGASACRPACRLPHTAPSPTVRCRMWHACGPHQRAHRNTCWLLAGTCQSAALSTETRPRCSAVPPELLTEGKLSKGACTCSRHGPAWSPPDIVSPAQDQRLLLTLSCHHPAACKRILCLRSCGCVRFRGAHLGDGHRRTRLGRHVAHAGVCCFCVLGCAPLAACTSAPLSMRALA